MRSVAVVQGDAALIDQTNEFERFEPFQDAMYLASNAFLNVEQIFRILRDAIEVSGGTIDKQRV